MTQQDYIDHIAASANITKGQAKIALEAVVEVIEQDLKESGAAKLHNVAIFRVKDKPARTARNPNTGEPVAVPAHRVVTVKPFGRVKAAVS